MTPYDDVQALGVAIKIMRILASLPNVDARRRVLSSAALLLGIEVEPGTPEDQR